MTPQDHIKLNKAKCLSVCKFVKFKFIEDLQIVFFSAEIRESYANFE